MVPTLPYCACDGLCLTTLKRKTTRPQIRSQCGQHAQGQQLHNHPLKLKSHKVEPCYCGLKGAKKFSFLLDKDALAFVLGYCIVLSPIRKD